MLSPRATTRVYALLGDPVAHSLSPVLHNAAMRTLGLDAVYVALRADAASLSALMRILPGGNVTVPHKAAAAHALARATNAVERTGACNTFWVEDGRVCGDNTDVHGFRTAALQLLVTLRGARVLVTGAGGAAAAALCALLDDGATVTLLNRTPERARRLAERLDRLGRITVAPAPDALHTEDFDLLVNATSVGLEGDDRVPLRLDAARRVGAVLDLVYRRAGPTPLVRAADAAGIPAADGVSMLVAQGAAAFERWFGAAPPLDVMRTAVAAARRDTTATPHD